MNSILSKELTNLQSSSTYLLWIGWIIAIFLVLLALLVAYFQNKNKLKITNLEEKNPNISSRGKGF